MGAVSFILDTCTLLWWWSEPENLSPRVLGLLRDPINTVLISAASAWEISTKYRLGKYPRAGRIIAEWDERLKTDGFHELAITARHALRAGMFPGEHRDPFDRMIAAQGLLEDIAVLSPDVLIESFGAERIW